MRKVIIPAFALCMCLCSCQKVLYTHYNYDEVVYSFAKSNKTFEAKDLKKMIKSYERIVEEPKGENAVPPPGACADYAYLLYLQGDKDKAKQYFQKEYITYPESKTYIEKLMQKIGL